MYIECIALDLPWNILWQVQCKSRRIKDLIALSLWFLLFLFLFSYFVKFLGTLTRVVELSSPVASRNFLANSFGSFGLNLERAVSSSDRIFCSRAPNLGVLCTPDRPPPFVWSLASEVGQAVLSRTKWVMEGCRCRLSSGCSTKSLWCLGIPSGNQQKPSRREVRRELSRREWDCPRKGQTKKKKNSGVARPLRFSVWYM